MNAADLIIKRCEAKAAQFEESSARFTVLKKARHDGAGKAYRIVCGHFAHLDLSDLQAEMLDGSRRCLKGAHDCRMAFPLLAASFEGYACAYNWVANLCSRLAAREDTAGDLWNYDAQREEVSAQRAQRDYREDVRRGMLP